jgi:hypothetical protein
MKYLKLFENFDNKIVELGKKYGMHQSNIPDHEMYFKMIDRTQIFLSNDYGKLALTLTAKINGVLRSLISFEPEYCLKNIDYIINNLENNDVLNKFKFKDTGHIFD